MKKEFYVPKFLLLCVFLATGLFSKGQILTEGFENGFLPAGWLNVHTTGDDATAIWESATFGADGGDDINGDPFTLDPHTGDNMATFNSYFIDSNNAAALISSAIDLSTPGGKRVSFWMHRDAIYELSADNVALYINTSAAVGGTLLGTVYRLKSYPPVITGADGWYKYSFVIPAGFNGASNYLVFEATSKYGNNIFIDDITVEEFSDCNGVPSAGTISGPASICPATAFNLTSTGVTEGAGMSYAWQSSASATGPWTTIPSQTNADGADVSQNAATYYRLYVTCSNSGSSDSSNVVNVAINAASACYCQPPAVTLHTFADDYITNVSIQGTTLNSFNGTDPVTAYTKVPPTPAENTADLTQLTSYTVTAIVQDDPGQVSGWIDLNQNGQFEVSEFIEFTVSGTVATGSFVVPSDAVLGQTGLRIRARFTTFSNTDACGTFGSGETEDYTVNIVANTAVNGALVDIIPPAVSCNANNTVLVKLRNSSSVDIAAGAATVALYVTGANPQTPPTQTNPALLAPGDTATLTFVCSFPVSGPNVDSAVIVSLAGDALESDNTIVTGHITLPAAVNAPFAQDFETGAPGWTVTSLAGGEPDSVWVLAPGVVYPDYDPAFTLAPKSGNRVAMFNNYTFAEGIASRLASNCINIPADAANGCGYVAGFYFTQDAQYNNPDSIVLSASADNGVTFTKLGVVKRQDSTLTPSLSQQAASVPQWRLYTFDVAQFAGSTVQFALDAYSAYGNQMAVDSFFVGPKAVNGNVDLVSGQETGSVLTPSLTSCADAGGWTYYTDNNSSRYLFGVQWDPSNTGANAAAKAQATAKITVDRKWYAAENTGLQMATYTMQRYWDVNLNGAVMTGPANVRFFYSQREFDSIIAAKNNFIAATGGNDEGFRWFKTVSGAFVPSPAAVNYDSVVNDLELQNVNTSGATINGILYAQFNGITSFSGGTAASGVGPTTPLPVGLLSFTAQRSGRVNKLSWTTTQEINSDRFIIEHSTDGRNFKPVGTVAAAGNSAVNINYSFIHDQPIRGINFYRLQMVDRGGHSKFSDVRNVRNEGTADIAIYPNPVKNTMLININSDNVDKAVVTIHDMNGKLVQTKVNALTEGSNYISINTMGMSSGTYIVKIQLNDDMIVRKVNKL